METKGRPSFQIRKSGWECTLLHLISPEVPTNTVHCHNRRQSGQSGLGWAFGVPASLAQMEDFNPEQGIWMSLGDRLLICAENVWSMMPPFTISAWSSAVWKWLQLLSVLITASCGLRLCHTLSMWIQKLTTCSCCSGKLAWPASMIHSLHFLWPTSVLSCEPSCLYKHASFTWWMTLAWSPPDYALWQQYLQPLVINLYQKCQRSSLQNTRLHEAEHHWESQGGRFCMTKQCGLWH